MAGCAQPGPSTPTVTPIANGSTTATIPAAAAGSSQSNPSTTVVPVASPENTTPEPATGTAATALPPAVTTGPKDIKAVMDYAGFGWAEYRMTKTGLPDSRVKVENQVSYKGVTASHVSVTGDISSNDGTITTVLDTYFNPVTGESLGGYMRMTKNGQVISTQELSAGSLSPQNPLEAYGNIPLTSTGLETVTVPKGTFEATKYTGNSTEEKATGSVWLAPGIPVPVKIYTSAPGDVTNAELVDWG